MSKGNRPQKRSKNRKKSSVWQVVVALLVVAGLASSWFLMSRDVSPSLQAGGGTETQASRQTLPSSLRNRMVLPAQPRQPRPVTLNPASFASDPNPEIYQAYKAAKDVPEVLEQMPCYCGCFATSGHRNNLDCYADNHGVTWALCRAIALEARRQHELGTPIQQIKQIVDEKWAPPLR